MEITISSIFNFTVLQAVRYRFTHSKRLLLTQPLFSTSLLLNPRAQVWEGPQFPLFRTIWCIIHFSEYDRQFLAREDDKKAFLASRTSFHFKNSDRAKGPESSFEQEPLIGLFWALNRRIASLFSSFASSLTLDILRYRTWTSVSLGRRLRPPFGFVLLLRRGNLVLIWPTTASFTSEPCSLNSRMRSRNTWNSKCCETTHKSYLIPLRDHGTWMLREIVEIKNEQPRIPLHEVRLYTSIWTIGWDTWHLNMRRQECRT